MLKTRIVSLLLILLSTSVLSMSQVRKNVVVNKSNKGKAELPGKSDELFESMLPTTAQILVIDSFIATKTDFIDKIPLEKDFGQISTYDRLNHTTGQQFAYTYVNGFGNRMFFAKKGKDGHYKMFSADRLDNEWTNVKQINDFGDDFEDINYPFMLADGTTLYFAAKSKGGLGGYDIYVTRYDISSEKFYKPENMGLPYNSKDNDFYCIIDEFNGLGWLVTDRRQDGGNVCVYVFVPQKERKIYDSEEVDDDELYNYAELYSIKDTWTDKTELEAGRERLSKLLEKRDNVKRSSIYFIVNDHTIYKSLKDFKSPANRKRFMKLNELNESADDLSKRLDSFRQSYSKSSQAVRRKLGADILKAEKQLEDLRGYIKTLEKEIRNSENMIER